MESRKPDEKEFRTWYERDGLTTYDIAARCGVSRKSVYRWMRKWGIESIPRKRVFETAKKTPLSDRQREIVVGSLLGDAHMARHGFQHRFLVGHCDAQKGLTEWIAEELGPFVTRAPRKHMDLRDGSVMWNISTLTHRDFDPIAAMFYRTRGGKRKKVFPGKALGLVAPLSLAVWFMDDGHSAEKAGALLATDDFDLESQRRLVDMLAGFGVESFLRPTSKTNSEGVPTWNIRMRQKGERSLGKLINKYLRLVPCMRYKMLAE